MKRSSLSENSSKSLFLHFVHLVSKTDDHLSYKYSATVSATGCPPPGSALSFQLLLQFGKFPPAFHFTINDERLTVAATLSRQTSVEQRTLSLRDLYPAL